MDCGDKNAINFLDICFNRRISPLRGATPEGYNAIFIDCVDPDISNFNFTGAMKAASVAIDALGMNFFHIYLVSNIYL